MLESYQQEITRKRKASRIFWGIVFLFAGLLYFFFQGYYPAIHFGFRSFSYETGSMHSESRDLIRYFGIVNVSAIPSSATMLLGSGSYSSDEKRISDYGEYTMKIDHIDYLGALVHFSINRETPYYIDKLTLIRVPRYTQIEPIWKEIIPIDGSIWMGKSQSGLILLDEAFSGSKWISSKPFLPIGEGYFLSGTTIKKYDNEKEVWQSLVWSGSKSHIETCREATIVRKGVLWCKEAGSVLTQKGKIYTGVLDVHRDYIELKDGILTGEDSYAFIPYGSGGNPERNQAIDIKGTWYMSSGSKLLPLEEKKITHSPKSINVPLEMIEYMYSLDTEILFIGRNGGKRYLVLYEIATEKFLDSVDFPEVSLEEVRIEKRDGNLFFKSKYALLFLYHNSKKIEWIIDGEILAFAPEHALYRKDGQIWKASWDMIE